MKILLTADPELPVPPMYYGGIERIIDSLAAAYREAGRTVLLVAHPESPCRHVDQLFGWPAQSSAGIGNIWKNLHFLRKIYQTYRPDVIHSFSRLLYLYGLLAAPEVRILQSYQRAIHPQSTRLASFLLGKRLSFTACAAHLYQNLPVKDKFQTVYNFTDTQYYTPAQNPKKAYLLFLGRLEPIKGAAEAVQLAVKTGRRLILAGNIPVGQDAYFENQILPYLQPGRIEYAGPVTEAQKLPLYQHAAGFLFPVQWEEPFGIVMAESLACGTPVIALNSGSVPEVIRSGVNGFICTSIPEMETAIGRIHEISRATCRQTAVARFSLETAGKAYLHILHQLRNGA